MSSTTVLESFPSMLIANSGKAVSLRGRLKFVAIADMAGLGFEDRLMADVKWNRVADREVLDSWCVVGCVICVP